VRRRANRGRQRKQPTQRDARHKSVPFEHAQMIARARPAQGVT
jgi:hypothetical protein